MWHLLGLTKDTPTEFSRHGYQCFQAFAFGVLGIREDGLMLDLPATALQTLRDRGRSVEQLITTLLLHHWHATRIDLAIDTADPRATPEALWRAHKQGRCTATAERWSKITSEDIETGIEATTVYLGRRLSSRMLRVYNKEMEVMAKTGRAIGPCSRWEIEYRREAAQDAAALFAAHGPSVAAPLLASWLTVHTTPPPERLRARPAASWWRDLIGADKTFLHLHRDAATPETTLRWLTSPAMAKTLSLAYRYAGEQLTDAVNAAQPDPRKAAKWHAARQSRTGDLLA